MSYDINEYKFLGAQIQDVIDSIEPNWVIDLSGYDDSGIFINADKKIIALDAVAKMFSKSWQCSGIDQMFSDGWAEKTSKSSEGPSALFARTILQSAGIKDEKFYSGHHSLLDPFLFSVQFLPAAITPIQFNGVEASGLVEVKKSFLVDIVRCFAANDEMTVFDSPNRNSDFDECHGVFIPCLKKALMDLLEKHQSIVSGKQILSDDERQKAYALESHMQDLLSKYICANGCEFSVEVVSSLYGDVHESGGMEAGIPYVVFESMQSVDDDNWTDPRTENPDAVTEAKNLLLVGEVSSCEWQVFEPKFGG